MTPAARRLLRVALVLGLAYGATLVLLYAFQRSLLFPATREIYRDPSAMGWAFEDHFLALPDGERTHAWWIPLEGARGTVLFSHGNAGNIADRLESIGLLRGLGLSVLAYDYGGYGRSSGRPSEERLYADIRAAWAHLTGALGVAPEQVVIFGRSLGAGPTVQLATEVEAGAVVVESTFLSVPEVAAGVFPWLPVRWLVRDRFDNGAKIGRVRSPVMVVHSPEDCLIPFAHGQVLFARAPEPKTWLEIRGDHNNGFALSQDIYLPAWNRFLDSALGGRTRAEGVPG
jgi:fermentation-respiration switch protein FrsA (DUF1100 family)